MYKIMHREKTVYNSRKVPADSDFFSCSFVEFENTLCRAYFFQNSLTDRLSSESVIIASLNGHLIALQNASLCSLVKACSQKSLERTQANRYMRLVFKTLHK